jgi:hypothetical protein
LFVGQDTSLNGNLYTLGKTIQQGDVSMNSRLFVGSDVSLNGKLYVAKNIGIGVATPLVPLDVAVGVSQTNTGTMSYFTNTTTTNFTRPANLTNTFSILSRGSILCNGNIAASNSATFSDRRIKTNIQPITAFIALDTIRRIQPKQFTYKDTFMHGNNIQYGFIAQDICPIVPSIVENMQKFIPNIYEIAKVSANIITLQHASTNQIIMDHSNNIPVLIKTYDQNNNETISILVEILNDKQFTVFHALNDSTVFVYGQEINDFLTIDKDAIFTLSISALKHMDQELQETNKKVSLLESKVEWQEKQIKQIMTELSKTMSF